MNTSPSEKRIMQALLIDGALSRKKLAEKLDLTGAALTFGSQNLLKYGYIKENGSLVRKKAGRRETDIAINGDGASLLGISCLDSGFHLSFTDLRGDCFISKTFASISEAVTYAKNAVKGVPTPLGLCVCLPSYDGYESLKKKDPEFVKEIESLELKTYYVDDVEALAYVNELYHPEEKNFLLINSSKQISSSAFVASHIVKGHDGEKSDIGNWLVRHGTMLRDELSFENLLGRDYDDVNEGFEALVKDEKALSRYLIAIAMCIVNANYLLSLDAVVLSGYLYVSHAEVVDSLRNIVKTIDPSFKTERIVPFDDFAEVDDKKASLQVFAYEFLG
ncbi:MAG: hypothetical protein LKF58_04525 [Bacilli bacterium]|nr:hypothetical protein [Bacilli bacterium]MCH4211014.1 hypothetical protein [Bacilli bacterium]MCH4277470.1 hypothetical protein [Bacilli bacterium]